MACISRVAMMTSKSQLSYSRVSAPLCGGFGTTLWRYGCGKCSLNTLGRSVPSNFGWDFNFGWSRIERDFDSFVTNETVK